MSIQVLKLVVKSPQSYPTQPHLSLSLLLAVDTQKTSCTIEVFDRPLAVTRSLAKETTIRETESVSFRCEVNKENVNAIWKKDGQVIDISVAKFDVEAQVRKKN